MYKQLKRSSPIEGEMLHHEYYDNPKNATKDIYDFFMSFDFGLTAMIAATIAVVISFFVNPLWVLMFLFVFLVCMGIDDFVHRVIHIEEYNEPIDKMKGKLQFLKGVHRLHHKYHDCNFAFCLGIIWDIIFRTYRSPNKE